jgi:hypothetical protein
MKKGGDKMKDRFYKTLWSVLAFTFLSFSIVYADLPISVNKDIESNSQQNLMIV